MKVNYVLSNYRYSEDIDTEDFMLVGNNKTFFNSLKGGSKYNGFFVPFKTEMLKIFDSLTFLNLNNLESIDHYGYKLVKKFSNNQIEYFIPDNFNSIIIKSTTNFEINFDIKQIFDQYEFGRIYDVKIINGKTIIHFKKLDENNSLQYSCFVVINSEIIKNEKWMKKEFLFDKKRSSPPYSRYVFSPGTFNQGNIVISYASTGKKAIEENVYIEKNQESLLEKAKSNFEKIQKFPKKSKKINTAYNFSRFYLNQISTDSGVLAGLPWFFRPWTRDELISLPAVIKLKGAEYGKKRLMAFSSSLNYDGLLPNITGTTGGAKDSIGLFFRFAYLMLTKHKKLFSDKEMAILKKKLELSSYCIMKYYSENHMLISNNQETWMDSLSRSGKRIEIQSLMLIILETMKFISKDTIYISFQNQLRRQIKKDFFNNGFLYDDPVEKEIRPNVFLAYYYDNSFLKSNDWKKVFLNSTKKLWAKWGGLATLDTQSQKFRPNHSGEVADSYHNGDSWFFVNLIAATTMNRLDNKFFKKYIEKILNASTSVCLSQGTLGCLPEVSSFNELKSQGSPLQAWSLATYIELVEELK
jgi:glycogen debranching enzyme